MAKNTHATLGLYERSRPLHLGEERGKFLVHEECGLSRSDIYEERWAGNGDSWSNSKKQEGRHEVERPRLSYLWTRNNLALPPEKARESWYLPRYLLG